MTRQANQVLITEHADAAVGWFREAIVEKWHDDGKAFPSSPRQLWRHSGEGQRG